MERIFMNIKFTDENNFGNFKKYISDQLACREKRSIDFPQYKKSAVLILFMEKEGLPYVVMTLRTDKVSTHKGQVSFPGGGYDPTDKDFLDTALRETMEEVGISSEEIEILGEFDEYISVMGYHVYVHVGAVNRVQEYVVCRDEIDEMLEVPFSIFYNEAYDKCEKITYEGRDYNVYYYDFGTTTIWGMTARIITDFARKIFKDRE
jgi:8-oxo-dGTP pyrophosphatase MutT (NUDIX family)